MSCIDCSAKLVCSMLNCWLDSWSRCCSYLRWQRWWTRATAGGGLSNCRWPAIQAVSECGEGKHGRHVVLTGQFMILCGAREGTKQGAEVEAGCTHFSLFQHSKRPLLRRVLQPHVDAGAVNERLGSPACEGSYTQLYTTNKCARQQQRKGATSRETQRRNCQRRADKYKEQLASVAG